jgi:type II secretion system protein N
VFLLVTLVSTVLFFAWSFPFGDLSDLATSAVARATGNQVYLQFKTMNLNLVPVPSVSASEVSVETPALPALEAKWLKFSPNWFSLLFNVWTLKKAASGDVEAAQKMQTRFGASIAAEGVLGADIDLNLGSGSKSESGKERSRVSLAIDKLSLSQARKWADLSLDMSGEASFDTTMQFTPGFADQPEGEIELHVNKFNLPGSTIMIPWEGAMLPITLPTLTLSNVVIKGRLVGGSLIIEDGSFGQSKDPINGRLKGQMALRLMPMGQSVSPQFGPYNLTVDLNTSRQIDKDLGFAFFILNSAKNETANGSHYLFRAQGQGMGPQYGPPSIQRIPSF